MDSKQFQHPYVAKTAGGHLGHWLRRILHVCILFAPILYYEIMPYFHLNAMAMMIAILIIVVLLELVRLSFSFVVFGQRTHEAKRISSFAWTVLALGLVLLFAPGKQFAYPIIWSCALVDPLVGELRNLLRHWLIHLYPTACHGDQQAVEFPKESQELPFGRHPREAPAQTKFNQEKNTSQLAAGIFIFILGAISVLLIWLLFFYWMRTPLWMAWLMAPITMIAEWPNLKWIDDNALMQLIPLGIVLVFVYLK